ncbi:MAG: (2Fe-2S) ferredoxin domain-containing protein [Bacteroidetes bacterium]|nr:MAG: (2Fe-2S) ferredoxin domain-containing protein [Bacteroidota bacterium]
MKFQKHVFICTNQRPADAKKSCGEACGLALVSAFKKSLKEKGLSDKIRAQKSGCLDVCEHGPSMVVYPEGVFYGSVQESDVEEIILEHLIENKPVKRLRIDFSEDIIK